ncbi:delta-60 repeat domain-containing protein [Conexibacter sp. DBS9H8]|uniref:delta-60 repeat domain-containing protein n=1 Tax=Conexibacter sp. DBS9H8 TaxID=2937801 RepID=UPI00200C84CC|nr:delta-60 repeat domain-containing protein [Conexibacter sp. DBS9H8]
MRNGLLQARRAGAVLGVSLAAVSAGAGVALAAGTGGSVGGLSPHATIAGPANTAFYADAVQPNGEIVAVGDLLVKGTPQLLVERYTATGALDPSFGAGGIVTGPALTGAAGSIAKAVAIQPNGQIVVVGEGTGSGGVSTHGMVVERFNANGSLDTGFGSGGAQDLEVNNEGAGDAVALEPDGNIVVGGSSDLTAVPYATVAELTANGSPDMAFGTDGVSVLQLGQYANIQALTLQSNGEIVFGGSAAPNGQSTLGVVGRLTAIGTLDTSFNGSGASVSQYALGSGQYSSVNGVAVSSNGTIYAAGNATNDGEVADTFAASFTPSGARNGAFGSGGVVHTPSANNWLETNTGVPGGMGLILGPNGDLLVPGVYDNSTATTYGTVWAFTPAGALDQSFGNHGVALLSLPGGTNSAYAGAALDPGAGALIAAGTATSSTNTTTSLISVIPGVGSPQTTTTTPTHPAAPPALKLTVTGIGRRYVAKTLSRSGLSLNAACNEGCRLTVTLGTNAGAARHLQIKTRVRVCRKFRGRRRCRFVEQFRPLKLTERAFLRTGGRHRFVFHFGPGLKRAFFKHPNTRWVVTVSAQPTAKQVRARSNRRFVEFVR